VTIKDKTGPLADSSARKRAGPRAKVTFKDKTGPLADSSARKRLGPSCAYTTVRVTSTLPLVAFE
jgi:hypothetical protein